MAELDDIIAENAKQWKAINALVAEVKTLSGTVAAQTETYKPLIELLKKALSYEFYVILFLIAALVYGAVGKDGLFAVRQTFPIPQRQGDAACVQPIAPPPDNRFHVS